jgi:trimethylamine--corrinoid protein Co-methyltransferase
MAGGIAVTNAEALAGLVMHQLKQPGAPFIYGVATPALDMRTSVCSYASPEEHMSGCISAVLARYYDVPSFSVAGCSDAYTFDAQAGMEAGYTILMHALSGCNMIHDLGYLGAGTTASFPMLLLGNEMVGIARYVAGGLTISPTTVPLELIHKTGPGGNFLTDDHTLQNFRTSLCFSDLLNRHDYETWRKQGEMDFDKRATLKARELLENHRVADLDPAVVKEIQAIPQSK